MAIDLNILKADREFIINDIPIEATFNEKEATCRRSVMALTDQGAVAGLLEDYVFSLHALEESDWETMPEMGDIILVDSERFRVLRIMESPIGVRYDMGAEFTERRVVR